MRSVGEYCTLVHEFHKVHKPSTITVQKKAKNNITILVVDDIPENLELFLDVFVDEGYQVLKAESGFQALEILSQHTVDLIVADALMPRMDGLELCKKVRSHEQWKTIPFIIYTSNYIDPEDEELAKSIGVDRYIMKSYGLRSLVNAVEEVLNFPSPDTVGNSVPPIDEYSFLERHHSIVMKKLEEKMKELEQYTEVLMQRNQELIASEGRYRSLFEQAIVGIAVLDNYVKKIVDVNKECCLLCGTDRSTILTTSSLPLYTLDGSPLDIFSLQRVQGLEVRLRRAHVSDRYVELSIGPIEIPNDTSFSLLFLRDITEQKRLREQMFQNERMTTMGRIAAGIAHEIRNPLAGISFNLQFLERRLQKGTQEHDSVVSALEGVERIRQVIEDTLGLARFKPPSFNREDIHTIVDKTLSYLKLTLRQKSIQIKKNYAEALPLVNVDSSQIQQVLLNILQNAIDASPEHGVIEISSGLTNHQHYPEREYVFVSIRDQGNGFTADVLEHLFEPFYTTKIDGTGLGLMISKYVIDHHQGIIEAKNDTGACVTVYLPREKG
ncbi:MAG: response regulator [Bacteroidetes bacterium]|nr:response regulator [Bacteroidota bacterium]